MHMEDFEVQKVCGLRYYDCISVSLLSAASNCCDAISYEKDWFMIVVMHDDWRQSHFNIQASEDTALDCIQA